MKKIKFSHNYPKLRGEKYAQLLQVLQLDLKELSPTMRLYDTQINDDEYYALPKSGRYLLLIFLGDSGNLFTTIRSGYPTTKTKYYYDSVGENFEINITPNQ